MIFDSYKILAETINTLKDVNRNNLIGLSCTSEGKKKSTTITWMDKE